MCKSLAEAIIRMKPKVVRKNCKSKEIEAVGD
jgi:hypothetical protein